MIKDKFIDTIDLIVKPIMKDSGFKKIGFSFYKECDDLIYLINIQNSTYNNFKEINFYINCYIHSKQMDEKLGLQIKTQPKEYECYFSKRIETILKLSKNSFTIDAQTNLQILQEELKTNLTEAIDYLIQINDADKLLDLMIKENGLQYYQELLTFLIKKYRIDQAKRKIRQLFNDFRGDLRWGKFEKKIEDILIENQSNLLTGELI